MAISDELTRIQTAKADIKASIEAKGVTVPSDALIDTYSDYVDEIQTGGGGGQAEQDLKDLIERNITSITIPSGTTTIGYYAFGGCTSLTSVTIPNSVTSIGESAFYQSGLTSITIPNSVTSIGSTAFIACSSLASLIIGSGVTVIPNQCFQSCSNLTSVTIPNSVTIISPTAFYSCTSLTTVTIGNGVTDINRGAFQNCSSLTSVTIEATTPPTLGNNALYNTNNCPIYVPSESVETYKTTGNWVSLASRIQAIPSE